MSAESFAPAATALLRTLCGPHGIHASEAATANYRAVFARDAVMAGIAGLLSEDPVVTAGLLTTLGHLRDLQGPEGQVASNFEVRQGTPHVSFGTVVPRLDAATWYLVGLGLAARANVLQEGAFRDSAERTVRLLVGIEYNGRHLLYVPTGGNWADEYLVEGYILYDQVLRAWGLRLLGEAWDIPAWRAKADAISQTIAARFWPAEPADRGHPVASFTPASTRDHFDLAAAALMAVAAVDLPHARRTLDWLATRFLAQGTLPPAFHPVIDEGHPDWPALRRYHLHDFRNRPGEYHNGGAWPIWLGWLALGQAALGLDADLARLRALVDARLVMHPGWDFEEYFHGTTGAPLGTPRMAYSATGLTFLRLAGTPAQTRLFPR